MVDRALAVIEQGSTARAGTATVVISQTMQARRPARRRGPPPGREVVRIDSEPTRPPRSLTADERQQGLDAVEASEKAVDGNLPDLTRMMPATGCRVGECLAIGWSGIDLDTATVDVRWRLVRGIGVGNVRRVWRQVRETLELDGLVTHTLRKTAASFLDDADVSTRRVRDQLGHAKVSMTQDRYLGRG